MFRSTPAGRMECRSSAGPAAGDGGDRPRSTQCDGHLARVRPRRGFPPSILLIGMCSTGSPGPCDPRIARSLSQGSGDLTLVGRKFGGSAQRRLRNWFLVHCTILHAFPLERIGRYLAIPARQPAYRAGRTHEDFLMNLDLPRTILHEFDLLGLVSSSSLSPATDVPHDLLASLLSERFANRAWIERL